MKMNPLWWYLCSILVLGIGLLSCRPPFSSSLTHPETDPVIQIQAQTIPIQAADKVVCEKEGCVAFDLRTVQTNIDWINDYFIERIQRTEPVAFSKLISKNPQQADQPQYQDQRFIQVEFIGQRGHLATFALKSSNQARNKAASRTHIEYINFDLKQKKRLALHQLIFNESEQKLLDAVHQANRRWLNRQGIQKQHLKLSDNYYFDRQGLIMVYPRAELNQATAGMSELKVPYAALHEVIRPEYLSILQQTASEILR